MVVISRLVVPALVLALACALPAAAQTARRVSLGTGGAQGSGSAFGRSFTADLRLGAFQSQSATLVPGDTNGVQDCFVRDLIGDRTSRVSVSSSGAQGNADSLDCAITPDGRYVVFVSLASNLVDGDTNGLADVFLRDRLLGITTRVSVSASGAQSNGDSELPQASPDGRFVLFTSYASNLVAGDTNGHGDLFLRDVASGQTTRLSVSTTGAQATGGDTVAGTMSADARFVVFVSAAADLIPGDSNDTYDVFVRDRQFGQTTRVSVGSTGVQGDAASAVGANCDGLKDDLISLPQISDDGRFVTFVSAATNLVEGDTNAQYDVFQHDRTNGATVRVSVGTGGVEGTGGGGAYPFCGGFRGAISGVSSPDGRFVSFTSEADNLVPGDTNGVADVFLHDRLTQATTRMSVTAMGAQLDGPAIGIAPVPGLALFSSRATNVVPGDTNESWDVFIVETVADLDGDGLPSSWERRFGIGELSAAGDDGPAGDPDGDGISNAEELARGTHPRGSYTRFLAEGAQNAFFATQLALANGTTTPARVLVRFVTDRGAVASRAFTIDGARRWQIASADLPELAGTSFSAVIESDVPLAVDRLMTWGEGAGYAGHAETGTARPSTTWFLAEGATVAGFNLFYLLQNPQPTPVDVEVRYLRSGGLPPIVRRYTLAPASRRTIYVNQEDPGLAAADVSAAIVASAGIIVERAMYATRRGRDFKVGHESMGVTEAAPAWFLAEGASGSFFDLYICIVNPNPTPTVVDARFLDAQGRVTTYARTVRANSRETIFVDGQVPGLADASVSTTIRSRDGTPIVVERVMYWGGDFYSYTEAHNSPGTTETGARWLIADAAVGTPAGYRSYVLVANTSAEAGRARVLVLRDEAPPLVQEVVLPANSRTTLDVASRFPGLEGHVSVIVEGVGTAPPALVVERAMYWEVDGAVFGAGVNSVATRIE